MRILIVGGTRFIGAYVARQLYERGDDVTVLHRGKTENPIVPPVRQIRDPSAEYPVLRYPNEVSAADWDAVIHMVLMGDADARCAVDAFVGRAARLVMISSGDVYRAYGRLMRTEPGPPDPIPLGEDSPKRVVFYPYRNRGDTIGPIAKTYEKILAERALALADALPVTILRLPKVYGLEDNSTLDSVYGFADQPEWRWTHGHVENVAAAIVLASTHPSAPGRTYNVGEAHTPTMAARLARLPTRPRRAPPPFDYTQSVVYDTRRIRSELGYAEVVDEVRAMTQLARKS
jgi:nucleoside-diphosphate-sugar epimerase